MVHKGPARRAREEEVLWAQNVVLRTGLLTVPDSSRGKDPNYPSDCIAGRNLLQQVMLAMSPCSWMHASVVRVSLMYVTSRHVTSRHVVL